MKSTDSLESSLNQRIWRDRNLRLFFCASLLVLVSSYMLVAILSQYLMYDFFGYVSWAQKLPSGGWVHHAHPVGYRLLLRIFYEVTRDYSFAGKALGVLMAVLALYSIQMIAALLSKSETVGLVAMFFTGINRLFFQWATVPSTDMPALALNLAAMYTLIRYCLEGETQKRRILWAGILFGLGYLMRYSAILPAIASGLWLILRIRKASLWNDLKIVLLYSAGFIAIAMVQLVPNLVQTGRISPTPLTRMIWAFYESETTGVSFTIVFWSPDAPTSLYSWILWLKGSLPQVLRYWSRNLFSYLLSNGFRITGPVWFLITYPSFFIVPFRSSKDRRGVMIYILLTAFLVVIFHSLFMFVGRYVSLVVPTAIIFSTMLGALVLKWFRNRIGRLSSVRRKTAKGFALVFVLLFILADFFAEFRVIYHIQMKHNRLYHIVQSSLRNAGMSSAAEVGTVFLSRRVYYDLDSPSKSPFDEIRIPPNSSVLDLRSAMVAQGMTYVVIDEGSRGRQPTLALALLDCKDPPLGIETVLHYPEINPSLAVYRLSTTQPG